jgi:hypothetical protein
MPETETEVPTTETAPESGPPPFAMTTVAGMPFATTTGLRVRQDLYDDE